MEFFSSAVQCLNEHRVSSLNSGSFWLHLKGLRPQLLGGCLLGNLTCLGPGQKALMYLTLHSPRLLLWNGNSVPVSKHQFEKKKKKLTKKPRALPSGVGTNVKGVWAYWSSWLWASESWELHFIFKHLGRVTLLQELTAMHSIKVSNSLWHGFFSLSFKTETEL